MTFWPTIRIKLVTKHEKATKEGLLRAELAIIFCVISSSCVSRRYKKDTKLLSIQDAL